VSARPSLALEIAYSSSRAALILVRRLISSRNSYLLRDALQPAEFIDLNDAGHAVTMECTEEVVEALVRNWKRNPSCDVNASSM
jgi:pimeloyl-ACP methyl ester carboxylesterase